MIPRVTIENLKSHFRDGNYQAMNTVLAELVSKIVQSKNDSIDRDELEDAAQDFLEACLENPKTMWQYLLAKAKTRRALEATIRSRISEKFVRNRYERGEKWSLMRNIRETLNKSKLLKKDRNGPKGVNTYGLASWTEPLVRLGLFNGTWDKNELCKYPPFPVRHQNTNLPNYNRKDLEEAAQRLLNICGKYCTVATLARGMMDSGWFVFNKELLESSFNDDDQDRPTPLDNAPAPSSSMYMDSSGLEKAIKAFGNSLTEKEFEVLAYYTLPKRISKSVTLHKVAERLGCSHQTINNREKAVFQKAKKIAELFEFEQTDMWEFVIKIIDAFEKGNLRHILGFEA